MLSEYNSSIEKFPFSIRKQCQTLLGEAVVDGGTNGGGGEKGGDPGQGFSVTGPHRFKLLAKLHKINQIKLDFHINQTRTLQSTTFSNKNLMGVNNENEPLSGTGPDKPLFDKSLQSTL